MGIVAEGSGGAAQTTINQNGKGRKEIFLVPRCNHFLVIHLVVHFGEGKAPRGAALRAAPNCDGRASRAHSSPNNPLSCFPTLECLESDFIVAATSAVAEKLGPRFKHFKVGETAVGCREMKSWEKLESSPFFCNFCGFCGPPASRAELNPRSQHSSNPRRADLAWKGAGAGLARPHRPHVFVKAVFLTPPFWAPRSGASGGGANRRARTRF